MNAFNDFVNLSVPTKTLRRMMLKLYKSAAVRSGSSQYININHNCIKYFGRCGLLEQRTQRENSCLGFDFCGRCMAPVNRTKQGPWPDIMLSAKAGASEPYRDRRRDSLISEIPPWHAAWPALIQPLWPLDRGPSVARRVDQSRRARNCSTLLGLLGCWMCVSVQA